VSTAAARGRPLIPTAVAVVLGAVAAVLAASVAFAVLSFPTTSVVRRIGQPTGAAAVTYADGSRHWVVVKHRSPLGAPLTGGTRTTFTIGQDPSGTYGHHVSVSATGADVDRVTVRWLPDAVVLRFASGHEVRVPARAFTGGR